MWRGCSDFGAICVMITEVLARRHCGRRGSINHRYGQCIIGVWPGRGEQGGISDITAFIQTEYHMCSGLGVLICVGSKWKKASVWTFCTSSELRWRPMTLLSFPRCFRQLVARSPPDPRCLCNKGAQALDSGCHGLDRPSLVLQGNKNDSNVLQGYLSADLHPTKIINNTPIFHELKSIILN